jgi:tRNA threonylcarbamoyladenosine biosynthesis protein TsaB
MSEVSRLLLGIDTSGSEGSLAIGRMDAEGGVTLMQQILLTGRHYADDVVPQLKVLFAQAGVTLQDFSAIVVVNGPGSFTGLRAGIASAKALAEVGNLPVLAISRLTLLARAGLPSPEHNVSISVLDAGRGEYYMRLPSGNESVASHAELTEAAGSTPVRACEEKVKVQLADMNVEFIPPPVAFDAILLAAPRILTGSFDDVATLDANYVRRPYANFAGPV